MILLMIEIGSPAALILTGLATLATALGAQKWLPDLIKRSPGDDKCRRQIEKIISAMSILLTILEQETSSSPGLKSGIKEAQQMIDELKREYNGKK